MFNVIDFFCGCGGTSAGLRAAGMNIIAGIDYDEKAIKTYQKNFPEAISIQKDIKLISEAEIEEILKKKGVDGPLVFSACAPCQPFSSQNRFKKESDTRVSLLDDFHRFVKKFKPDYIFLENVPGMQKVLNGPFSKFIEFFSTMK